MLGCETAGGVFVHSLPFGDPCRESLRVHVVGRESAEVSLVSFGGSGRRLSCAALSFRLNGFFTVFQVLTLTTNVLGSSLFGP